MGSAGGSGGDGAADALDKMAILEEKRTASREEVDRFVSENRFDPQSAAIFKKEPADIQARVINRGTMDECKNPSAALMGRLRDARQQRFKPTGGRKDGAGPSLATGAAGTTQEVEAFISENKIDMGAARALRAETPDIQQGVMDRGTLEGFQNPSALVMARIKDVKAVRKEASNRNVTPGQSKSGGSSGQKVQMLTREELRKAVEMIKAGKTISMSSIVQAAKQDRRER